MEPSREDCTIADKCPFLHECPYEVVKSRAKASNKVVLNVHYANYTNFWRDRPFVFLDEAHNLPNVIAQINEFAISDRQFSYYGLPRPNAKGSAGWALDNLRKWISATGAIVDCNDFEGRGKLNCIRFKLKLSRMQTSLTDMQEGDVYIINDNEGLRIKTVNPTPFARRLVMRNVRNVLMSATIGNYELLARELGIDWDVKFMSVPHPFPKEIRPVVFVQDMPSMGRRASRDDWRAMVDAIKTILDHRTFQKGIIHVSSWSIAKSLERSLAYASYGWRCYVPGKNREAEVAKFIASDKPLIAISPSWREGIDLPDEHGRLSIIAKLPYPNMGDPIVKLKLRRADGWAWYRWVTALGVVQAAGRVVRHANDYGETFILDGSWKRVRANAPMWFEPEEIARADLESWLALHRKEPNKIELARIRKGATRPSEW